MDGALYGSTHPDDETSGPEQIAPEPSGPEPRVITSLAGFSLSRVMAGEPN